MTKCDFCDRSIVKNGETSSGADCPNRFACEEAIEKLAKIEVEKAKKKTE